MGKFIRFSATSIIYLATIIHLTSLPIHALVIPPLKAGVAWNIRQAHIAPSVSMEIIQQWRFTLDFGVTYDTVIFKLGYIVVPIVDISPFAWGGYNIHERAWTWGIGISWIRW